MKWAHDIGEHPVRTMLRAAWRIKRMNGKTQHELAERTHPEHKHTQVHTRTRAHILCHARFTATQLCANSPGERGVDLYP